MLTKRQAPESTYHQTDQFAHFAAKTSENAANEDKSKRIARLVKHVIPEADLNEDLNSEISFVLPADKTAKFSELFEKLDENKDTLGIDNVGISISTLEDVFLK